MTHTIETVKIAGKDWTVVMEDGTKIVWEQKGTGKRVLKAAEQWVAGKSFTLEFYRESAARADEMQAWIKQASSLAPKPAWNPPIRYSNPKPRRSWR